MSTATRPIRDDEHGTLSGYAYHGCRCPRCCEARRTYNREHPSLGPTAESCDLVLTALEREADFDGLVIAGSYRLAEVAGLSHTTVLAAVRVLAESGRIKILGRHEGRGAAFEIQLGETA